MRRIPRGSRSHNSTTIKWYNGRMSTSPSFPIRFRPLSSSSSRQRFRAIGEPMRIRLLDALRDGPLTVNELAEALGASQQNVSKHIGVLAQAGIVAREKDGTRVRCSIADETVFQLCELVCGGLRRQVAELDQLLGGAGREPACPIARRGWPLERACRRRARPASLLAHAAVRLRARPCSFRPPPDPGADASSYVPADRSAGSAAGPRPTSRPSPSPGSVIAIGLGVVRAEGRARPVGRRLGGHRLGVGRRCARSSIASSAGCRRSALMVVVHSDEATADDPAFRSAARAGPERSWRPTSGSRRSCRRGRAGRSRLTATPPSSRPARPRAPTRWSAPPTTSRTSSPSWRRRHPGVADRRVGHVVGLQRGQQVGDAEVRADLLAGDARHPGARVRLAGRGRAAAAC